MPGSGLGTAVFFPYLELPLPSVPLNPGAGGVAGCSGSGIGKFPLNVYPAADLGGYLGKGKTRVTLEQLLNVTIAISAPQS